MTKEGQEIFRKEDKPGKTREGEKTSRFRHSDTSEKCAPPNIEQMQQNPMDMVKSLVSQLPGLDRDTVYVISGPFPNYDPAHGHSQLIMATPISPGVTVVAVPSVPPSCTPLPPVPGNIHVNQKTACSHVDKTRMNTRTPQPPHMLHWDTHHPVGQTMPLRQPNPPVYYNVPSNTSSGLQSPASDGSYLSDNSSTMYETSSTYRDQKNVIHNYGSYQPHLVGYPQQGHRQHHSPHHQVPVLGQQTCWGHRHRM